MVKKMANSKRKPAPAAKKKRRSRKGQTREETESRQNRRASRKKRRSRVAQARGCAKAKKPAKKIVPARKPAEEGCARQAKRQGRGEESRDIQARGRAKPVRRTNRQNLRFRSSQANRRNRTIFQTSQRSEKGKMAPQYPTRSDTHLRATMAATRCRDTVVINLPAGYHPAREEEYMGPRQLAYFRAKLQKWREDLVEESKQTIDNLRDEVRDVGDEAERATRETENSLELRTRDRYRKLIAKIDKALKRIEEGRYGYLRGNRRGNRHRAPRSAPDRHAVPRRAGALGASPEADGRLTRVRLLVSCYADELRRACALRPSAASPRDHCCASATDAWPGRSLRRSAARCRGFPARARPE